MNGTRKSSIITIKGDAIYDQENSSLAEKFPHAKIENVWGDIMTFLIDQYIGHRIFEQWLK